MVAIYGRKILPDRAQKVKRKPVSGKKTPVNGSRTIKGCPMFYILHSECPTFYNCTK